MKMTKRLIFTLFFIILLPGSVYFGYDLYTFAIHPSNLTPPKQITYFIGKNSNRQQISHDLEAQGVISSAKSLLLLGRLTLQWSQLKRGEYLISSTDTPLNILTLLASGKSILHALTVHEGDNLYQVAEQVEALELGSKKEFIETAKNPLWAKQLFSFVPDQAPSLEGFLYPDTYSFDRLMSIKDILTEMLKRFEAVWSHNFKSMAPPLGLSDFEVVTLASMIEKETGAAHERPKISSVFINRLRKKMRLESDPTTIYGLWETFSGNLTRSRLKSQTPYNTYTIRALPIGPISNPGKESILAVFQPEESSNLFFVSQNDGTHVFTTNYRDHSNAVKKFQINRANREGKSWRQLKTSKKQSH